MELCVSNHIQMSKECSFTIKAMPATGNNHSLAVTMPLYKKEFVLIVKLFYQNDSNPFAELHAYRRMKRLRRGPISVKAVKSSKNRNEPKCLASQITRSESL
ncbi:hypothetical protein AVEN_115008-1 [Araneus ventricosus]|uniref:DUF4817 domain-containing protein n=1 Tax=Araneus ventricosus TaxID=182803 RepID=A0A4Y1ZWW8_ARAVE|nr:hypothetical protein AVEN_115008-1 [Araneus ventricosus]